MKEIDNISLGGKKPKFSPQSTRSLMTCPCHLPVLTSGYSPRSLWSAHTTFSLFFANGTVQPQGFCTGCSLCLGHCSSSSSQGWIPSSFNSPGDPPHPLLKFIIFWVPGDLLKFGLTLHFGQLACLCLSPHVTCASIWPSVNGG